VASASFPAPPTDGDRITMKDGKPQVPDRPIVQKTVTYDLARQMEGAKEIKCSEFAEAISKNL
jgi:isocitrate dehydrogenase